ncbi:SDR family oxidoreductase [Streptomyces sp. NPDC056296]|uniref:SDR family oxidoreductase n=1 Tax=Streptomyces sp. NPDC056296 TaxID=3345775 RepID=UPI0035E1FAA3
MTEWMNGATAFITGGAQGIGLGIARSLARQGVKLALADIDVAALQVAKTELAGITPTETFELDVRDRDAYAAVADKAESALGPVTLLFNNAGIAPAVPVEKAEYRHWDWAMGINLNGVYNGIQTFVPRMIERGQGGYVVNTASGAGLVGGPGFLYTTSKFAVVGLSESLRMELDGHRIGVSVLCPGPVDTQIIGNTINHSETGSSKAPHDKVEFLKAGVSIDAVGDMVLAGMESRQMWIHTDGIMRPHVKTRMEALLESIPQSAV